MYLTYAMEKFDHLRPDELSLRVPMAGEVVQVGALPREIERYEQLAVIIEPPEIRIARADENPLQIVELSHDEALRPVRRMVLAKPIAQLVLHEGERSGQWGIEYSSDLRVAAPEALGRFLELVAVFAYKKQNI